MTLAKSKEMQEIPKHFLFSKKEINMKVVLSTTKHNYIYGHCFGQAFTNLSFGNPGFYERFKALLEEKPDFDTKHFEKSQLIDNIFGKVKNIDGIIDPEVQFALTTNCGCDEIRKDFNLPKNWYYSFLHNINYKTLMDKSTLLELLSGIMQLGEKCCLRNVRNYEHSRKLKYLPFTISPEYVYYFPLLSTEGIKQGIEIFQKVLDKLLPLMYKIPEILEKMETAIKIEEKIKKLEKESNELKEIFGIDKPEDSFQFQKNILIKKQQELEILLKPFKKKFAFVYKGFKGPKDVMYFQPSY